MKYQNLFELEDKLKSTTLKEKKDPNRLFITARHHYYYLNKRHIGGSSLASIIDNCGRLPKSFKSTLYSRARKELGEEFHDFAECKIRKKQKDSNWKWELDPFSYADVVDKYFDEFYYDIFQDLNIKNIITEFSFVGVIKNKKRGIRVAGTFDAFDYKNGILYEWKTANNINEDKWKLQCMIYALILKQNGYPIKKIIIYYVRATQWRQYEGRIQFRNIESYTYDLDAKEIKENWTAICKKLLVTYWDSLPKNVKFEIK